MSGGNKNWNQKFEKKVILIRYFNVINFYVTIWNFGKAGPNKVFFMKF